MDAVYRDQDGRHPVRIVGVLYGARVQVRFEWSGEVIVPISLLEVEPLVAAELELWRKLPPGALTDDEYTVLDSLQRAGAAGLLDSQYPLPRKQVEHARRVLKHKGLVGPADSRPSSEGEGRSVRWHLTRQGVLEYVEARTKVRAVARGGGRSLATAVG